jgi:hypothetical protein
MKAILGTIFCFGSITFGSAMAAETVLMIDQMPDKSVQLAFPNETNIQPKPGDFTVINYVPMSSEDGDRWAIVTLKNASSGSRIFESQYLMGLFADGERRAPLEYKQTLNGSETVSVTLAFGRHKFPLLSVVARE